MVISEEGKNTNLLKEYIERKLSASDLEKELLSLIKKYNKKTGSYLLVYTVAMGKSIPDIALQQSDFYSICNLLEDSGISKKLDMYIETPGGRGETAEEIVRYVREKFDEVNFVISGEAKSAGTIIALSGDNIMMTKTGSLGPIDAQVKIGRSVVSAHNYMEWINSTRDKAEKNKSLNPFDATMAAQISPRELKGVVHSLKFAQDLVKDWLVKYKFKNWKQTETQKKEVSHKMKEERAEQIAQELSNHSKWKSHGRSLKIKVLKA